MMGKAKRTTQLNRSYCEKSDSENNDPISSDDTFHDPTYNTQSSSEGSEESFSTERRQSPNKISTGVKVRTENLVDDSVEKTAEKPSNCSSSYVIKKSKNKKVETKYILEKRHLLKAVEAVKSLGEKKNLIQTIGKSKVLNLCTSAPKLRTKSTAGGRETPLRQLLYHLNRSVLKHDWASVASIIEHLLRLSGRLLPIIWKAVFLVFFNSPKSNQEKFEAFLQMCVGLRTQEEKVRFIRRLLTLPRSLAQFEKPRRKSKVADIEIGGLDDSEIIEIDI